MTHFALVNCLRRSGLWSLLLRASDATDDLSPLFPSCSFLRFLLLLLLMLRQLCQSLLLTVTVIVVVVIVVVVLFSTTRSY